MAREPSTFTHPSMDIQIMTAENVPVQTDNLVMTSISQSELAISSNSFNDPPPSFAESQRQKYLEQNFTRVHHVQIPDNRIMLKSTSTPSRTPNLSNAWEFAGWGSTYYIDLPLNSSESSESNRVLLGQWRATSISGNDLVASVFYTIGLCTTVAGKFAPISLLIISIILYPFKNIISEVGTTLPLNGGAYNCLLNTSPKWFAAVAAALSLLDYVATAVVSAAAAVSNVSGSLNLSDSVIFWLTIGVILLFAGIVASGLKESSNVAFIIFIFHCLTLTLLMITCLIQWIIQGNSILIENWKDPGSGNPLLDIFNGVCIGLLGITGFETSSNYIEDQKPGVFPKTMRNMWVLALVFNAPISFFATSLMPLSTFKEHQNDIIATLGGYAAGNWLKIFIIVDAVIVLGAGVLTGFVGVTGLIYRMASDNILPQFLLSKNRFTGTHHWIILSFFIFCITLFTIVNGNITSLSGVFAVAFLSDLCMYAIGNIFLKYKRGRLYRPIRVSTGTALFGLACILSGLVGNIIYNPSIAEYFAIYFDDVIIKLIKRLKKQPVVFFTKTDELHVLNKAILYVKSSEPSGYLKLIHIYEKIEDVSMAIENIPSRLEANHRVLDELYPKIQIDLIFIQGVFNPKTVDCISKHFQISKSLMFIACPGRDFLYKIGEFGGVRTIML
ncbi:9072_t:CDS:10 [Cetraspora pellucida]|uniref:9072_t:CDS:1 n=1 Tax=Cetraspora pellucida TaxID=1433469 RepID=A0A9N8ZJF0_9GLOM|nr:9072_t:CDS:10 [Cetraspora pellucida]